MGSSRRAISPSTPTSNWAFKNSAQSSHFLSRTHLNPATRTLPLGSGTFAPLPIKRRPTIGCITATKVQPIDYGITVSKIGNRGRYARGRLTPESVLELYSLPHTRTANRTHARKQRRLYHISRPPVSQRNSQTRRRTTFIRVIRR